MNDKIKQLLENAEKVDGISNIKWRIANREQLRKERKEKLKELMEKDKQQTPLEWFIEQIEEKGDLRETPSIRNIQLNIDTSDYMELKQKAKEMEKERTINFTEDWYFNGPLLGEGIDVKNTIEKHFNNTYGGGEQ
jgi:hypothetical protein